MSGKSTNPRKPRSAPGKAKASTKASPAKDANYEVGYGRPPASSRFVKGHSGNPRGRPRKSKPRRIRLSDAVSDSVLEQEVYRTITLRENGEPVDLTVLQALVRSIATGAIKGNRLSQKFLLEYVARAEEQAFQRKFSNYQHLTELKRNGERTLTEHRRRGWPPPDPLPHPDDIVLIPAEREAYVNGPETPEDLPVYKHMIRLRDHLLLRSAHANDFGSRGPRKKDNGEACAYLVYAQLGNAVLPVRFRWQDNQELTLLMHYSGFSRRVRERLITTEWAELLSTMPKRRWITHEMEEEIERMTREFLHKQDQAAA